MESEKTEDFDCKIFDGAALVHILKPNAVETFQKYTERIFVRFLQHELQSVDRVDVVWDRYLPTSIKGSARERRGKGVRRKVSA